jgi:hypothetical protein
MGGLEVSLNRIVGAAAFVFVMAIWAMGVLAWYRRRAATIHQMETRLDGGLARAAGTRVLRLWKEGKQTTTTVPVHLRRSMFQRFEQLRRDAGVTVPVAGLSMGVLGTAAAVFVTVVLMTNSIVAAGILAAAIPFAMVSFLKWRAARRLPRPGRPFSACRPPAGRGVSAHCARDVPPGEHRVQRHLSAPEHGCRPRTGRARCCGTVEQQRHEALQHLRGDPAPKRWQSRGHDESACGRHPRPHSPAAATACGDEPDRPEQKGVDRHALRSFRIVECVEPGLHGASVSNAVGAKLARVRGRRSRGRHLGDAAAFETEVLIPLMARRGITYV